MRKFYFSFIAALLCVVAANNELNAQCTPGSAQTFTNNTVTPLTDNGLTTSTITVSGAPTYLYDLNMFTNITHTFSGDLDITITSPSGTVVTLTTDNGGGNDNVFAGTVWDDNANPGGQVPYTANNGLVSDHTFTNLVVATPLAPEEPLGAFIGENPNGVWTLRVSDDASLDVGTLQSWSLTITGLAAAPTLTSTSTTNNTVTPLTDNGVTTSTITISGAGTSIRDVNVFTNILHTFSGDIDMTLRSPAGTIVTLTTDNGGGNDNVFAGTLWDDNANPGGQVPYTSNNGMVTDHTFTNLVVATPLTPEEALSAFIGENPNGVWTLTISDDASLDVGTLNSWRLDIQTQSCSVASPCVPGSAQTFTNNTVTPLTDNGLTTSTITVSGAPAYLYDLNMFTNITHTFSGDLDITITSPAGTVVTLTTDNGGGNDNVFAGTVWDDNANPGGQVPYTSNNGLVSDHTFTNLVVATPLAPEEPLGAFIGENPNGVWTLRVSDDASLDVGTLQSWSMTISGLPAAPTLAPTSATNNTVTPLTDNGVTTSTITISGAGTQIQDVNVFTNITHTFSGDIDMTLRSPAGTIVTLTTDNGGGNDNVFAGTLWDDKANPGGQVPYTANNGMVTDHTFTNLVVATPLTPEEALAAFIGEDPNGVWTLTISDDASLDVGTLNSWRLDIQTSLCGGAPPACAGTPTPGTITGPATACAGTNGTLTLAGQSTTSGIGLQWRVSTTPGGPYTDVSGATTPTLAFTADGVTKYYIVVVTCSNSGLSATTPEFTVAQGATTHTSYSTQITTSCAPGTVNISGTAAGGNISGYAVLGTSGTVNLAIPDNNATGVSSNLTVASGSFPSAADLKIRITASHSWVGDLKFALTSPCGTTLLFDRPGVTAAGVGVGNGDNLGTNSTTTPPPATYTFDIAGATVLPETTGGSGFIAAGTYKPSDPSGVAQNWSGLTFPCNGSGTWRLTITDGAAGDVGTLVSWQVIGPAQYLHTLTGPGTITQNPSSGTAGSTGNFTVTNLPAGTHSFVLTSTDAIGCSATTTITGITINPTPAITFSPAAPTICNGQIQMITANVSPAAPVQFSPTTALFTDPAGNIPYTGQPINVVYAKPTTTTVYTASSAIGACTSTANITVTVNQLPAITVQPTPTTQTLCPGFTANYSVTATGTNLTYQWKKDGVNLVNNAQISGATTNALQITNVSTANAGVYTVVVSGTCSPAVTSNGVTLNVGTAPVISAQPLNKTACDGSSTSFTVATTGSVPPATIYQWQISTDGGTTWTNLTTNGSFTPTYTIPVVTLAMNNNRYRVIVTNTCGQSTTSSAAILTVNPAPTVTASPLPARICISDTLVPLVGSPAGGSWSGIGVSGFNFVPSATAVGTYTLTYTYTNSVGCTGTSSVIAKVEDCQERVRLLRDDALILYPNPNNGRFNVRINSTLYNYLGMKVYNTQGQLVNGNIVNDVLVSTTYGGLVYGRVIPVDLTKLPAGIYLVKFYYDDGVRTSEKTFKVVVGAHE